MYNNVIDAMNSFLHIVVIGSGYSELRSVLDVQMIEHVRKRFAGEIPVTTESGQWLSALPAIRKFGGSVPIDADLDCDPYLKTARRFESPCRLGTDRVLDA
jgi:hypothetical protein